MDTQISDIEIELFAQELIDDEAFREQLDSIDRPERLVSLYKTSYHLQAIYCAEGIDTIRSRLREAEWERNEALKKSENLRNSIPVIEDRLKIVSKNIERKKDTIQRMINEDYRDDKLRKPRRNLKELKAESEGLLKNLSKSRGWEKRKENAETRYSVRKRMLDKKAELYSSRLEVLTDILKSDATDYGPGFLDDIDPEVNKRVFERLKRELKHYTSMKSAAEGLEEDIRTLEEESRANISENSIGTGRTLMEESMIEESKRRCNRIVKYLLFLTAGLCILGIGTSELRDYMRRSRRPPGSRQSPEAGRPLRSLIEQPRMSALDPEVDEMPIQLNVTYHEGASSTVLEMAAYIKPEFREQFEKEYLRIWADLGGEDKYTIEEEDLLALEAGRRVTKFQYEGIPERGKKIPFTVYGIRKSTGQEEKIFDGFLGSDE